MKIQKHNEDLSLTYVEFNYNNNMAVKLYPKTLVGDALHWFHPLLEDSVYDLEIFIDHLVTHFNITKANQHGLVFLLNTTQQN
jgi:hypothetical protein